MPNPMLSPTQRQRVLRRIKHGPALPRDELPNYVRMVVEEETGETLTALVDRYTEAAREERENYDQVTDNQSYLW